MKFKDLEAIEFDHFNFVIFLERKQKKNKKCLCDMEFTSCFRFSFSNIEKKEKNIFLYALCIYRE